MSDITVKMKFLNGKCISMFSTVNVRSLLSSVGNDEVLNSYPLL